MRLLHDRLYGEGTGQAFLRGDYLADLPRAVGERLKVLFDAQGRVPLPQGIRIVGPDCRSVLVSGTF